MPRSFNALNGERTGFGLATGYGIVRQSGGFVRVESEPGLGSTFRVFFPQVETNETIPVLPPQIAQLPGGTETLLLVDESHVLCDLSGAFLQRLGYRVLTADESGKILAFGGWNDSGPIDLVLLDVATAGANELWQRVQRHSPLCKVLYVGRFAHAALLHQRTVYPNGLRMDKPFTPLNLARRVREVLDSPPSANADAAQQMATAISSE